MINYNRGTGLYTLTYNGEHVGHYHCAIEALIAYRHLQDLQEDV